MGPVQENKMRLPLDKYPKDTILDLVCCLLIYTVQGPTGFFVSSGCFFSSKADRLCCLYLLELACERAQR
jgi:hypothetical protein